MKPFPFAIWPNKKSLAEDLHPLVEHLNAGPVRVAHDNWESAKVGQHLSGMSDANKENAGESRYDKITRNCAAIALRHRLKNLHGVDISRPGALRVPDSASGDMGTLSSLARIGGVELAKKDHENDESYANSDLYMHGTKSNKFFNSGIPDPKFFAETADANSFGPALYTENVTRHRFPARSWEARLYTGEILAFPRGGALAFRMHRKARIVNFSYKFSKQEQKNLYEFLREIMPYHENNKERDESLYKDIKDVPHLERITGVASGPKLIQSLALATIGIDAIKNEEGVQGRTVILPHAVHNMRRVGSFSRFPDNPDLETFRRFDPNNPPPFLDHPSLFSYVGPNMFPKLAVRGTQDPVHNGNSVLEHTQLGMRALDISGLSERTAQLLKLAFFLHDVGKTGGAQAKNFREKSVGVAKQYLDAQQKNAFKLTDEERKLVEHLIRWHDVFGSILAELPQTKHTRDSTSRGEAVDSLFRSSPLVRHIFSDLEIKHLSAQDTTDLLGRMWEANMQSTPGFNMKDGSNIFSGKHAGNRFDRTRWGNYNARTTRMQRHLVEGLIADSIMTKHNSHFVKDDDYDEL